MRLEAKGLESILAKFAAAQDDATVAKAVARLAGRGLAVAKENCPVNTGGLRNSISLQRVSAKEVHVVVGAEYGIFLEYGTGQLGDPQVAHTNKEKWSYQAPDGKWYTTHGQPAQPFMQPAAMAVRRDAEGILKEVLAEKLSGKG